jgi:hypothetical protein
LVVPRATAVLRRTIACSGGTDRIGLAEIGWEHLFKDDIMEPAITHVVFVDEALTRPDVEVSKGDLGAALALKKNAGYSIREICEIVGISRNTYYKYTRADATPHAQTPRVPGSAESLPASESVEKRIAEERSV